MFLGDPKWLRWSEMMTGDSHEVGEGLKFVDGSFLVVNFFGVVLYSVVYSSEEGLSSFPYGVCLRWS